LRELHLKNDETLLRLDETLLRLDLLVKIFRREHFRIQKTAYTLGFEKIQLWLDIMEK